MSILGRLHARLPAILHVSLGRLVGLLCGFHTLIPALTLLELYVRLVEVGLDLGCLFYHD